MTEPVPTPAPVLTTEDLRPFLGDDADTGKAAAMIEDVLAQAVIVAPCLLREDLPEHVRLAARAILRGAVLRWHERGGLSAAVQQATEQVSAIGFQHSRTTTTESRGSGRLLWPSEISDLEAMCRALTDEDDGYGHRAFGVDLAVTREPVWIYPPPDYHPVNLATRPDLWTEYR